jgi:hypothetical protein
MAMGSLPVNEVWDRIEVGNEMSRTAVSLIHVHNIVFLLSICYTCFWLQRSRGAAMNHRIRDKHTHHTHTHTFTDSQRILNASVRDHATHVSLPASRKHMCFSSPTNMRDAALDSAFQSIVDGEKGEHNEIMNKIKQHEHDVAFDEYSKR